jgi:hypothetical protein
MSHYYHPNGESCFSVTGKNGLERKTTIRDARSKGLYPSITTILKIIANDSLLDWIRQNDILAALTARRIDGENDEALISRIIEESNQTAKNAAEWGSGIHALISEYITTKNIKDDILPNFWYDIMKWIDNHLSCGKSEETLVNHDLRIGGTIDYQGNVDGRKCLLDFKTQGTKKNKPVRYYDSWAYQLGGYLALTSLDNDICNVIISSSELGRIEYYIYIEQEKQKAYEKFLSIRDTFFKIKEL